MSKSPDSVEIHKGTISACLIIGFGVFVGVGIFTLFLVFLPEHIEIRVVFGLIVGLFCGGVILGPGLEMLSPYNNSSNETVKIEPSSPLWLMGSIVVFGLLFIARILCRIDDTGKKIASWLCSAPVHKRNSIHLTEAIHSAQKAKTRKEADTILRSAMEKESKQ